MSKYKIWKKKDTSFGGWGNVVDFMTGDALKLATEGIVEAETPEEAKKKASEQFNIPQEELEVQEVK